MSLNRRLISTGAAICNTETTDIFGDGNGVALYSLDYDASTAPDASTDYSGTPSNVDFGVGGQINYGARFNGTSSYIDTGIGGSVLGELFSVSVWFKTSTTGTYQTIFDNGGNTSGESGFTLVVGTDNVLKARFGNSDGVALFDLSTGTTVTDGNWHHCVLTYNDESVKIYLDNSTPTTGTNTKAFTQASNNLRIGAYVLDGTILEFNGDLDQIRVFSSELTDAQVETLYEETACVHTSTTDQINYPTTNVAYYKLDGSAEDSHGNTYDGTESNIEYRFGRYGQAAVFNGTASASRSKITTSGLTTYNNFSISFWANPDDVNSTRNIMGTSDNYSSQTGFGVFIGVSSGQLRWRVSNGSSTVDLDYSTISIGRWYHIVITQNTSNNEKKLYVNGNLEVTSTSTINARGQGYSLIIGGYNTFNTQPYDGKIDQVRIFSTALTSDQVTELYNEKQDYITKDASDPFGDNNSVALYEMENNANDTSGNGNNGTAPNVTFSTTDPIRGTYSAEFNGSSSRINTGYQIPSGLSGFSVSAWVKAASVKTQFIVGDLGQYGAAADGMFQINISSSNKLRAAVGGTVSQDIATLSGYTNTWTHIVVTTDSSGNIIGYVNGSQVGTASGNSLAANTEDFIIGMFADISHSSTFNGDIDQVRIFDRTLDGTEAYQLYAEGARGTGL